MKVITATGAPPLYIKGGDYIAGDRRNTRPSVLLSEASNFRATPGDLIQLLCKGSYPAMERSLQATFPNYRPQMKPFFAARDNGKEALETVTEDAIQRVQRVDHDCVIDLCRFDAIDKEMATDRLQAGNVPWKKVRTTRDGQVAELAWHGQQPTMQEMSAYSPVKAAEDMATRTSRTRRHVGRSAA